MVGQDAKGQVRTVDVAISDEGRGVIPLRGRGSDQARAPPHSTAMYAIPEKCVEALEAHRAGWGGSGFEGRSLEDRYGAYSSIRCRSWTNHEQTRERKVNSARLVLLSIPSGVVRSSLSWKHRQRSQIVPVYRIVYRT